jgi:hypothetical protein
MQARQSPHFSKKFAKLEAPELQKNCEVMIRQIVRNGFSLKNAGGIKFHVDQTIGTYATVFGVFGPHLFSLYGGISLIFKPEILEHPDSYILPQCASSYAATTGPMYNKRGRPWSWPGPEKTWPESRQYFNADKLHPCVRSFGPEGKNTNSTDFFRAVAIDFIARIVHEKKKTSLQRYLRRREGIPSRAKQGQFRKPLFV